MKKFILLEGDKPVETVWEGDENDEQGLVEALSDKFVEIQGGKRDDGNDRNITTIRCLKLGKKLEGDDINVQEICQALADGETTFRIGDRIREKQTTYVFRLVVV